MKSVPSRAREPVVYYDVVVAQPFATGAPQGPVGELLGVDPKADAALKPAEGRKRTEYKQPTDSGVPLVPAVKVVPLAFDTFGRWSKDAADELKRWARRRLKQADVAQSVRARGVYAELNSRWRATAGCALQRGNLEVYADCVGFSHSQCVDEVQHDSACSSSRSDFVSYLIASATAGR